MSDDNTFNFELVSPERILVSEPAWRVTIPGEGGTLGVLKGHASFVVSIKPGVVEVLKSEGGKAENIFIAGGFADVSAENVTVLAEEAINVNDLDKEALQQQVSNLNEDLAHAESDQEKSRISENLKIAEAKLAAAA